VNGCRPKTWALRRKADNEGVEPHFQNLAKKDALKPTHNMCHSLTGDVVATNFTGK
jgi:hypothetical protein